MASIGVPFELAIVASEIGSYKPAHGHWRAFEERDGPPAGRARRRVALPRRRSRVELGLPTVWINRLGESCEPPPTRELPDLVALADTLDELVA